MLVFDLQFLQLWLRLRATKGDQTSWCTQAGDQLREGGGQFGWIFTQNALFFCALILLIVLYIFSQPQFEKGWGWKYILGAIQTKQSQGGDLLDKLKAA